ncbi:uncharacterized protein LOC122245378 [Penaeus japonicus]|uniref:uncharacterized protein LOC122245378 n=1 Tax=Penaeus japonicus TaxID=27405 RepID=UPI001C7174B2|nr:uncharacterized protein LOC122245378 [Penaeus japonicus]
MLALESSLCTYLAMVVLASLSAAAVELPSSLSKIAGDVLDTPEWLQDIPEESKVSKYRKRRFINFPTGSNLEVELTLTIPVEGLSDSGTLELINTLKFNLPNDTDFVVGRSFSGDHQRSDLYHRVETFLDGMGYDGHACTLRTICEVAEMPFEHGLIGEVLNLMMSVASGPSNYLDNNVSDEYALAEYYGHHHGSCYSIYPNCPISVTNLFSRIVPTF